MLHVEQVGRLEAGYVPAQRHGVPGAPAVPGADVRPGGAAGTSPAGTARRAPPGTRRTRPSRGTCGARRGAPREHRCASGRRYVVLDRRGAPGTPWRSGGCTCSTRRYRRTNMSVPGAAPPVPASSWIQFRVPGPRDGRTGERDGRTGCATGPLDASPVGGGIRVRHPGPGDAIAFPYAGTFAAGASGAARGARAPRDAFRIPPMTSRRGPPPGPGALA